MSSSLLLLGVVVVSTVTTGGNTVKLGALNIDPATVVTAGLGDSADFAHQFHIAFSKTVSGACVFSGQVSTFACTTSLPAAWTAVASGDSIVKLL